MDAPLQENFDGEEMKKKPIFFCGSCRGSLESCRDSPGSCRGSLKSCARGGALRPEGIAVEPELRARAAMAALLAIPGTALAPRCVSKAKDRMAKTGFFRSLLWALVVRQRQGRQPIMGGIISY